MWGAYNPRRTQNIMKTKSPRTWLTALVVLFTVGLFITVTGWLLASPSDEISRAVVAGGRNNVKAANADQFINAFSSVLVGVDESESASYVAAAKKLRPDLSARITATAAEVDSALADPNTDDAERVSRHRRRVRICCDGHQFSLPPKKARHYLATHPECSRGPCSGQITPTPHA